MTSAGRGQAAFVLQLPAAWTLERIAADHVELVTRLETPGAEALRAGIEESTRALLETG